MEKEFIVLLGALFAFFAAVLGSFLVLWREVRGVHTLVNSRMGELLELTRKAAHAAGIMEAEDERNEGRRK